MNGQSPVFILGAAILGAGLASGKAGLALVGGALVVAGLKPRETRAALESISAQVAAAVQTTRGEPATVQEPTDLGDAWMDFGSDTGEGGQSFVTF